MTVNRDQLFAELDGLSADEIEAGLDAGVWSGDRRQLVEHYLDQMKLTTMQMEAAETAKAAAQAAEGHSRGGLDHRCRGDDRCNGSGLRRLPCPAELELVMGSPHP
jgi:hypothetical protein